MTISYNGYTSFSSPSKVLKVLNATEYGVQDHDVDLKTFNIAHDEKYKIPMIKAA